MIEDAAEYCRALESHLCQKNEGHLIRIVGPAFEQVCGWAEQGVPLAVAKKGIDQYCERYYAKGPKRRPVRIEFCEADILDLFDGWRRAVGVTSSEDAAETSPAARDSLPSHLERAIARLTAARGGGRHTPAFDDHLARCVRELETLRSRARARGAERSAIVARLSELDAELMAAALAESGDTGRARLRSEAEREVTPFAIRMTSEGREAAIDRALARLVRESLRLPALVYE